MDNPTVLLNPIKHPLANDQTTLIALWMILHR
jgi:hypothetical protein